MRVSVHPISSEYKYPCISHLTLFYYGILHCIFVHLSRLRYGSCLYLSLCQYEQSIIEWAGMAALTDALWGDKGQLMTLETTRSKVSVPLINTVHRHTSSSLVASSGKHSRGHPLKCTGKDWTLKKNIFVFETK